MGSCLTICEICLPCPFIGWVSPCVPFRLMIGLMMILLFEGYGEYGFSTVGVGVILGMGVEFKGNIMVNYSRGVKWQQGFTTRIRFWAYDLGWLLYMCHNGVVVKTQEYPSNFPELFSAKWGYDLLFSVNMVNLSSGYVGGWESPEAWGEHLTSQLSWVTAWPLVKSVCPVHLLDRFGWIMWRGGAEKQMLVQQLGRGICQRSVLDRYFDDN